MVGAPCFAFYAHTSPNFLVTYLIRSRFLRWGMEESGKSRCLLQDCVVKLLLKTELSFWLCQLPDLCSMHSGALRVASTNQTSTATCPSGPQAVAIHHYCSRPTDVSCCQKKPGELGNESRVGGHTYVLLASNNSIACHLSTE